MEFCKGSYRGNNLNNGVFYTQKLFSYFNIIMDILWLTIIWERKQIHQYEKQSVCNRSNDEYEQGLIIMSQCYFSGKRQKTTYIHSINEKFIGLGCEHD